MSYHTILVAFVVEDVDREAAERHLHELLPEVDGENGLDCWWVAEDERYDRSDCDSAVFCGPGNQQRARSLITAAELD